MKYILLITVIVANQPASIHHFEVWSPVHCDLAKAAVEKGYAASFSKLDLKFSAICIEKTIEGREFVPGYVK
jgi:hypothetical protein